MRVVIIGGTRFVGRALVEELLQAGHVPLLVHRGIHEPDDLPDVQHLHTDRRALVDQRPALDRFRPDSVVDLCAMTAGDAEGVLAAVAPDVRLVVASSIDVYRAYAAVASGLVTEAVPLDEQSPVRTDRPPDRDYVPPGWDYDPGRYEKLDVEAAYLAHGGTVCRLPMIYGEHDYKHREEFILRRVRARRERIPVGSGSWLWSRGYAPDLAAGMRLALETDDASGEILNFCEASCASIGLWAREILDAATSSAELVEVPEELLPEDLEITATIPQHWLVDPSKARDLLGWEHSPPEVAVRRSVEWHLGHPPEEPVDFGADDAALEHA